MHSLWSIFHKKIAAKQSSAESSRETYLYKHGEYNNDENCRLKQVFVWDLINVQQRDEAECHSSTKSAIWLQHMASFKHFQTDLP